jgi:hypothetical protein
MIDPTFRAKIRPVLGPHVSLTHQLHGENP